MNEAPHELGVEVFAFVESGGKFVQVHGGIPLAGYILGGCVLKGFDGAGSCRVSDHLDFRSIASNVRVMASRRDAHDGER